MEFVAQINALNQQLFEIEAQNSNTIRRSEISIILCRNELIRLRSVITQNDFPSVPAEIHFFKVVKQAPLSNLVYHSELRSFESRVPKAPYEVQKKYVEKKMAKLNRFFIYNLDFVNYIDQDKSYLDEQFFTRAFFDKLNITNSNYYFRDPTFSTSHDLLLAKLHANKRLLRHLSARLNDLGSESQNNNHISLRPLKWTASKVALTELIYALYHNRTINHGATSIKEIATSFQQFFDFDLGDFYKIYTEIRMRKKSRTKFLDDLSMGLLFKMDDNEK